MKTIEEKEARKLKGKSGIKVSLLAMDDDLRRVMMVIRFKGEDHLLHTWRGGVREFAYPQSAFRYIRDNLGLTEVKVTLNDQGNRPDNAAGKPRS